MSRTPAPLAILLLALAGASAAHARDVTPPDKITDLVAVAGVESVTLTWTNTGDDGMAGQASFLDVWYSTAGPMDDNDYLHGTDATGEPAPLGPGVLQSWTITGLSAGTQYWFVIWIGDEVWNYTPVTYADNATATPLSDSTPPATTTNLATSAPTGSSITLTWTAPGDDGNTGTASLYDVRYSTSGPITDDTAFAAATQAAGEPAPSAAGAPETFVVNGLSQETLYHFALKTSDGGNWSGLSNSPSGQTTGGPGSVPNSWTDTDGTAPFTADCGGIVASGHPDELYAVADWSAKLNRYTISTGTWSVATTFPFSGYAIKVTSMPGTRKIFVLEGNVNLLRSPRPQFYEYDAGTGVLSKRSDFPSNTNTSFAMAATGTAVYVAGGMPSGSPAQAIGLRRYASGSWISLAPPPTNNCVSMAYPGSGDYLYAIPSSIWNVFWRYSISGNTWVSSSDAGSPIPPLPANGGVLNPGPTGSLYLITQVNDGSGRPDAGFYRYDVSLNQWTLLASTPSNSAPGLFDTGKGASAAYPGAGGLTYLLQGGSNLLWNYSIGEDRFLSTLRPTPGLVDGSGILLPGSGGNLIAFRGNSTTDLYRYSVAGDSWTPRTAAPATIVAAAHDGNDSIYACAGTQFWRYSIGSDQWSAELAPVPAALSGGSLAFANGHVYALIGNNTTAFHRYSVLSGQWESRRNSPYTTTGYSGMAYPGSGDFLYVRRGLQFSTMTRDFWVYSISQDLWNVREDGVTPFDPADLPSVVSIFSMTAHPGGKSIYLSGKDGTPLFWKYSIDDDAWTTLAVPPGVFGAGYSIAFSGNGYYLYALRGGKSRTLWRYQTPNAAPEDPVVLAQYFKDGTTPLPLGAVTIEDGVVVKAPVISDPDGDPVRLEIRIRPVGTPFDPTGDFESPEVPTGSPASLLLDGLSPNVSYRWEARARDPRGAVSDWIGFGMNPAGDPDFSTRTNAVPTATSAGQFAGTTGAAVPVGLRLLDERSITFRIGLSDPDGDGGIIEVEVVRAGRPFTGTPTLTSGPIADGQSASMTLELAEGPYSWRYRIWDSFQTTTGWMSYGGNPDSAADFELLYGGSTNRERCVGSAATGGFPILAALAIALIALIRR